MTDQVIPGGRGVRRGVLMFTAYLALAVATSWPIAAHLDDATPGTPADLRLTAWIFSWQAHVFPSNPTSVFQAPYYYPATDALALNEHLLGFAPLAVPLAWITGNPYVALNATLLLAIAFSCFAAALLGREVTGTNTAAFVAGAAYGFAPYWGDQIIHLHIVASGWIPMAMFGLVRWSRTWSPRWLALVAGSAVMAALTSWHQVVFLGIGLGIAGIVLLAVHRPPSFRPLAHAVIAATAAGAVLTPFAVPYSRVAERYPDTKRMAADVAPFSARPSWYLAAPRSNLLLGEATTRWRKPRNDEASLYPGLVITTLALVGLFARRKDRRERTVVLAAGAVLVAGILLSAGVGGHGFLRLPWEPLSAILPPLRALRAASRAHVLTVLAISIMSGLGARALLRRVRVPELAVVTALVLAIALEGTTAPRQLGPAPRAEAIYSFVASRPGPVLEFPVRPPTGVEGANHGLEVDAMMRATAHWQPLVQGYAAYYPPTYVALLREVGRFPDSSGLEAIRRAGIRTLVVRMDVVRVPLRDQVSERLAKLSGITLLRREGPVSVYDVAPR